MSRKRVELLIIDPQVDFCDPARGARRRITCGAQATTGARFFLTQTLSVRMTLSRIKEDAK